MNVITNQAVFLRIIGLSRPGFLFCVDEAGRPWDPHTEAEEFLRILWAGEELLDELFFLYGLTEDLELSDAIFLDSSQGTSSPVASKLCELGLLKTQRSAA